jgi:hypothetical protein
MNLKLRKKKKKLQENRGETYKDFGVDNNFLHRTPNTGIKNKNTHQTKKLQHSNRNNQQE